MSSENDQVTSMTFVRSTQHARMSTIEMVKTCHDDKAATMTCSVATTKNTQQSTTGLTVTATIMTVAADHDGGGNDH
eukprot:14827938-Ditylum_brightwellii.AAC.1